MARRLTNGRDLVQTMNPRTGRYVMVDRDEGRIIGHKPSPGLYQNVPIARRWRKHAKEAREHTR